MRDLDVFQTEGTEELNFKYLDFWLMDPFVYDPEISGDLFINLGSISEDALRDDMLANEAIISIWPEGIKDTTPWGIFGKEGTDVSFWQEGDEQDFGLDGLNNIQERVFINDYLVNIHMMCTI